ncbi:MAG: integrin alpha [Candidatus Midichloria sp.]|nr:integrin alpha [Candidatus Midichloria sp.]
MVLMALLLMVLNWEDKAVYSVASAGDINGDGKEDIIIGAPGDFNVNNYAGQAYVVYGQANFTSPLSLSSLNGTNGFIINGINPYDFARFSVFSARDINGNGKDDLIIGAIGVDSDAGAAYVILDPYSSLRTHLLMILCECG